MSRGRLYATAARKVRRRLQAVPALWADLEGTADSLVLVAKELDEGAEAGRATMIREYRNLLSELNGFLLAQAGSDTKDKMLQVKKLLSDVD